MKANQAPGRVSLGAGVRRSAWLAVLAACAAQAHEPTPPWQAPTSWPDRVIATFDGDPTRRFAVTWRTDTSVGQGLAQIVEASADARFDLTARTVTAKTYGIALESMETADGVALRPFNRAADPVHYHSVSFDGLKPDTKYAWRVRGRLGCWTEWHQTSTAPGDDPLAFVFFGDAQNGIRSHWSRVIREAHRVAPDAAFYVHGGDLVNKGDDDREWAEWFTAGGHLHAMIPSVPVVGNHEYIPVRDAATGKKKRVLTPLWRAQFTLPVTESLASDLHEAVYSLRPAPGLHLFVLNSAPSDFAAQARWLDEQLRTTDATWRVVTMHHPYFVPLHSNRLSDNTARIAAFTDVINKHEVDLVIVGHIHTYVRGVDPGKAQAGRLVVGRPNDVRTVFVISSSGAKVGGQQAEAWVAENVGDGRVEPGLRLSVDRVAGNTPMFQVVRVDGNQMSLTAHTAVGDVYDQLTISKSGGRKMLVNGPAAVGSTRLFENTGPYRDPADLK